MVKFGLSRRTPTPRIRFNVIAATAVGVCATAVFVLSRKYAHSIVLISSEVVPSHASPSPPTLLSKREDGAHQHFKLAKNPPPENACYVYPGTFVAPELQRILGVSTTPGVRIRGGARWGPFPFLRTDFPAPGNQSPHNSRLTPPL